MAANDVWRVWRKPIVATVLAAGAVVGFHVYEAVHADDVIPPAVARIVKTQGTVNVVVGLGFSAEAYNSGFLEANGSMAGATSSTVDLLDVTQSELQNIAHQYWVKSIRLYHP
jgi:hypothetical protein